MRTVTLPEAHAQLADLIRCLTPGDVVTITDNNRPVARLIPVAATVPLPPRPRPPVTGSPEPGRYAGRLIIPDDFNEPLEELREYVE